MGINLQLVDASYPCREGREGPELASTLHYAGYKPAQARLLEEFYCMCKRVLQGQVEPSTP